MELRLPDTKILLGERAHYASTAFDGLAALVIRQERRGLQRQAFALGLMSIIYLFALFVCLHFRGNKSARGVAMIFE